MVSIRPASRVQEPILLHLTSDGHGPDLIEKQSYMELSSEGRGLAGIMISRRPWRRASREYAPGPRHKSAIAMTAVNTAETLAAAMFNTGGKRARAVPKLVRAVKVQTSQLNSPKRSSSPHITESVAKNRVNIFISCQERRSLTPAYRSVTPTAARNNSSPKPGVPSGKIGKVDRSVSMDNETA